MICKGCNQESELIKAHIIPESFFTGLRVGEKPPKLMTDIKGKYPKKSPIGIYDKNILCRECEDNFQEVDDYGYGILLGDEGNIEEITHNNETIGYKFNDIDYGLLKLFFISVLWRASISTHEFYSHVRLGPFQSKAQSFIWDKNPGALNDFDFVLCKFTEQDLGRAMLDPRLEKWKGVNFYRFYMYGYVLHIKVDQRQTPDIFQYFSYKGDNTLTLIARDFQNSHEFDVLKNVVSKSRQ